MVSEGRVLDLILLESVTCKSLKVCGHGLSYAVVSWRKCSGLLKPTMGFGGSRARTRAQRRTRTRECIDAGTGERSCGAAITSGANRGFGIAARGLPGAAGPISDARRGAQPRAEDQEADASITQECSFQDSNPPQKGSTTEAAKTKPEVTIHRLAEVVALGWPQVSDDDLRYSHSKVTWLGP